jgi:hypothetical protein
MQVPVFADILRSSQLYHQGRTLRTASKPRRLQSFAAMPLGAVLTDVSTEFHIF